LIVGTVAQIPAQPLADQPTRGSLADDAAVAGGRRHSAAVDGQVEGKPAQPALLESPEGPRDEVELDPGRARLRHQLHLVGMLRIPLQRSYIGGIDRWDLGVAGVAEQVEISMPVAGQARPRLGDDLEMDVAQCTGRSAPPSGDGPEVEAVAGYPGGQPEWACADQAVGDPRPLRVAQRMDHLLIDDPHTRAVEHHHESSHRRHRERYRQGVVILDQDAAQSGCLAGQHVKATLDQEEVCAASALDGRRPVPAVGDIGGRDGIAVGEAHPPAQAKGQGQPVRRDLRHRFGDFRS